MPIFTQLTLNLGSIPHRSRGDEDVAHRGPMAMARGANAAV
jgi:hypothetical protein